MPSGTIQFRVFTSDANIPLPGVTVILRQQDSPYQLLGILVTDESGQTPVTAIETCDASLGQSPGSSEQPWVSLRAYVEHPAYEEASFSGIQLFPGILTVQNVQLLPNQFLDHREDDLQEYITTPQPLRDGGDP